MTKKEAFRILRITHDIKYTYKNADGSVNIPKALQPYMGGKTKIERKK